MRAESIPTYIRVATGGAASISGVRPGVHTICASPASPRPDDPLRSTLKCVPAKLDARLQQKVEVVFPAAWFAPAK